MPSIQSCFVPHTLQIQESDTTCKKAGKYCAMPFTALPYAIYKIAKAALSTLAKLCCCKKPTPQPLVMKELKVVVVPPPKPLSGDNPDALATPSSVASTGRETVHLESAEEEGAAPPQALPSTHPQGPTQFQMA
ncbi:MAG: hypothetical protein FJZ59_04355 [Chlamydiae bacterium]|nr:hypothetical protein [Chlamydiota bacterium]